MVRQTGMADHHEDTIFGLVIGTLAILVTVLVLAIYDRAQDASKHRLAGEAPKLSATKP